MGLLDQLCAAWDRPQGQEALGRAYWNALRDVRFEEVQANVQRILRTASGKQSFPKPADLRDEAPSDQRSDSKFQEGERRAIRNLEELRHANPEAWKREVKMWKLDRIIAVEDQSSPI
jgi:hypothetical protein